MSGIKRRDPPPRTKRTQRDDRPDIDFTKDEFERLTEAMKKEEFRKLFLEYMDEIQDPENRKKYQEEFQMFEAERGVDVKFVNPEPGFVIKTSQNGNKKCFINCAQNEIVAKPSHESCIHPDTGERGFTWAIPMAQSQPREDLDNKNKRCQVYDVVFHPDALYMAERNKCFRKCLIDTALDAVEREFEVKLDRVNLKYPKLKFKGMARPAVIRTLMKDISAENEEPHPLEHIFPPKPTAEAGEPKMIPLKKMPAKGKGCTNKSPEYSIPKYTIKYRRGVDLSEYTNELDAKLNVTKPKEIAVEIDLPLLKSTAECELDVTEQTLYLLSEKPGAKYRLNMDLPHKVVEKEGRARFDIDTRRLIVTLPVIQDNIEKQTEMHQTLLHLCREDSGVESDIREDTLSSSCSPDTPPLIEELASKTFAPPDEQNNSDSNLYSSSSESTSPLSSSTLNCKFLLDNLEYQVPLKFDFDSYDRTLSWVLHVRNVQTESLAIRQIDGHNLHLKFTSIGAGFYPAHYAFYIQLPEETKVVKDTDILVSDSLHIVSSDVEAWENNVVLNVHLDNSANHLNTYLAGLDADNLAEYSAQIKFSDKRKSRLRTKAVTDSDDDDVIEESKDTPEKEPTLRTETETSLSETGFNKSVIESEANEVIRTNYNLDEDYDDCCETSSMKESKKLSKKQKRKNKNNRRSLSESACDDLVAVYENQQQQQQQHVYHQKEAVTNKSRSEKSNKYTKEGDENDEYSSPERDNLKHSLPLPVAASASLDVPKLKGGCNNCDNAIASKFRSFSESRDSIVSGGSVTSSNTSSYKGILKHYSHYDPRPSISDSCSSFDDYSGLASYSPSMDRTLCNMLDTGMRFSQSFSDIPEENCTGANSSGITIRANDSNGTGGLGLSESCKKTVRFSEVIRKQVFRMDSSILGQRKKNQKRRERKKRALQRRLSEGDSVDYEDKNEPTVVLNQSYYKNNNNNSVNEFKNIKCGRQINKPSALTSNTIDSESSSDADAARNTLMFDMDM